MTDTPPPNLPKRIAQGLLFAAYPCDGTDCRATDQECEAAHAVRRPAPWRYVVRIEGSPEGLAAAVLAVVQPELDARDAEIDRLRAELAALTEAAGRFTALMETDMEKDDISAVLAAIRAAETVRTP